MYVFLFMYTLIVCTTGHNLFSTLLEFRDYYVSEENSLFFFSEANKVEAGANI